MWDANTITAVKRYLGTLDLPVDDILVEECIDRAESHLEEWTGRRFVARKETRRYDYPAAEPTYLILDGDLQKIIKLSRGDGELVSLRDVRYHPANRGSGDHRRPAYAIELVNDAYFTYADSPVQCIGLRASWGYSMKPDAYTYQALIRLTAFLYKQKDAQVFETASFVEGGVLVIPEGVPKYVADFIIARYRQPVGGH